MQAACAVPDIHLAHCLELQSAAAFTVIDGLAACVCRALLQVAAMAFLLFLLPLLLHDVLRHGVLPWLLPLLLCCLLPLLVPLPETRVVLPQQGL
jgi:hypothetical protein